MWESRGLCEIPKELREGWETRVWFSLKLISSLPFKNSLICFRLSFSPFCMRICTQPQNAPLHSPFMIILHWNPDQFHDHLALDNSRELSQCF